MHDSLGANIWPLLSVVGSGTLYEYGTLHFYIPRMNIIMPLPSTALSRRPHPLDTCPATMEPRRSADGHSCRCNQRHTQTLSTVPDRLSNQARAEKAEAVDLEIGRVWSSAGITDHMQRARKISRTDPVSISRVRESVDKSPAPSVLVLVHHPAH